MSGTFFCEGMVKKFFSMAIFPFLLIQEEELSVNGKRMCTKYMFL